MIRSATSTDYGGVTSLFRQRGLADPAPSRDRWTADLMRHTLVVERADRLCGYVTFFQLGSLGHVSDLVVTEDARNTGVGRTLMTASAAALHDDGATDLHVHVKADNAPAIHLYEKLGMTIEHRSTVLRVRWDDLAVLPGEPASTMAVTIAEDDDVERTLGLPSGRVALARRPGHVLVSLRDRDLAVVGFAAFDPGFPGILPFHVARPELAPTLLAALRPHARHDHVQLVTEDDAAVTRALAAAGAAVRLEVLHYRGAVPALARRASSRCA